MPTEADKKFDQYIEASDRAAYLRKRVANSSAPDARIWQTLNHLGGRVAGDAADASIRHIENMQESEAEDQEKRAAINRAAYLKAGNDSIDSQRAMAKALRKK